MFKKKSTPKIALCFIINYEHILYKEELWREWIEQNKDIINVYFFYKDLKKIKSKWILEHTIPIQNICYTSYYHVIPAYIAILNFALKHDKNNKWFCYLTDSCCPIIKPSKFRSLFDEYKNQTIMSHANAHWNIEFHKRANLALLPKEYHLANDPWFVLTRENAIDIMNFVVNEYKMCNLICNGGLANESLFAIILTHYKKIQNVLCKTTHMADWFRMSSSTSPHLFKEGNEEDMKFIENFIEKNEFVMFIRKIHSEFPNEILRKYICDDVNSITNNKMQKKIANIKSVFFVNIGILCGLYLIYVFYLSHLTSPSITT
jgi:Core-2/I-Branching enzyme